VIFCGLLGQENWPLHLPPPLLANVPMRWPVAVTYAVSVAVALVLVASTVNRRLEALCSAV
jgi:hypothetical protein